jgi:hypothetical protein
MAKAVSMPAAFDGWRRFRDAMNCACTNGFASYRCLVLRNVEIRA